MLLVENPKIGRNVDYLSNGLFKHEHQEHVIFYRIRKQGIFVIRLLHVSMDATKHI